MKKSLLAALSVTALAILPGGSQAHFLLLEPANRLVQSQLGDPQKVAPCGGWPARAGTPAESLGPDQPGALTNAVTPVRGGDMLHLKIHETVFHPGHYRIALAVKAQSELPPDPQVTTVDTPNGPRSVSAKIAEAKAPILADGLFEHTEKQAPGAFWEADVKMPNINCDGCTLQVIEFMGEHAMNTDGDYSYHHCATLRITANPALAIDKAWPGQ